MYLDLSLQTQQPLNTTHLLQTLSHHHYSVAAVDYYFQDSALSELPPSHSDFQGVAQQLNISLYSRATLSIEQPSTLHQLNQQHHHGYDILAVRPKTQKIFHTLCVEYENYDIISLDIGIKLPFMLKRNPVYEALRKGKYFQIQYNSLFDDNSRIIAMTNIINLIKATGGQNLIVSSHAQSPATLRTPYDVAALLVSLGLTKNQALATMKSNAENVLKTGVHRGLFKSTIGQLPPGVVGKLGKRIKKHREDLKKLSLMKTDE